MYDVESILWRLSHVPFRKRFKLKPKDIVYIKKHGLDVIINEHTKKFLDERFDQNNFVDGEQTPYKGHPTFIAQHATATCCRGCLQHWHRIAKEKELTDDDKRYMASVIKTWIEKNYD